MKPSVAWNGPQERLECHSAPARNRPLKLASTSFCKVSGILSLPATCGSVMRRFLSDIGRRRNQALPAPRSAGAFRACLRSRSRTFPYPASKAQRPRIPYHSAAASRAVPIDSASRAGYLLSRIIMAESPVPVR